MNVNQVVRVIQSVVVGVFGLYALIVAFGNVTDFQSNFNFVQGV